MQSLFSTYLQLGIEHITDLGGYDHILFILALCAVYQLSQWKRVALLITAFTIGHSLTLALAIFQIIQVPQSITEFFIALTILLLGFYHLWNLPKDIVATVPPQKGNTIYLVTLIFGFIHGLGFSSFFQSTIFPGEESQLFQQLFAFNLGVELGQLIIVAGVLLLSYFFLSIRKVAQRDWIVFVSGVSIGLAMVMLLERWPF